MKRREFIRLSGMGTAFMLIGNALPFLQSCRKQKMEMTVAPVNVVEGSFNTELRFPPILNAQGSLTAQVTNASIFKNKNSSVLGYSPDAMLGPTVKVNTGQSVNITVRNELSEPTNIHWHGIIVPEDQDGHPDDLIHSGNSYTYSYMINQRAGMYWYHPHAHGTTASQVFKGLAGAYIINDSEESALNLPGGLSEAILVIQDKRVFPDYSLDYSPNMSEIMAGYMGEYVLVNGIYSPFHKVATLKYRVRILNGSNARIYNLSLSDNSSFYIIGSDGGLLQSPQQSNSVLLGPGERVDLIVDFTNYALGTELFLLSRTFPLGGDAQGKQEFRIMKFIVDQTANDSFTVPASLSAINFIPESSAVKTRVFDISNAGENMEEHAGMNMTGMHKINDKIFDSNRIDETIQAGSTEIWVFDNSDGDEPHPMHIHGLQFQVLDRVGGRNILTGGETGWKDTVLVLPGEKVRVIMTFPQNTGKFVFHCHNLEHEDDGMMLQFKIV